MICVIISIVKTLGSINILENTNILINNEFNAAKVRYYTNLYLDKSLKIITPLEIRCGVCK